MIELIVAALIQISTLTGTPAPTSKPGDAPTTTTTTTTTQAKTDGGTGAWDDGN